MSTIALVDDDKHIRTSLSMALEAEGYHTQTYSDGATALVGLQETPPDIAILDIKMPRMDGMELLRQLRQHSDVPVIFLTSMTDEIDELIGLKMGAADFVRKPFSQRVLMERVKVVLRQAHPRESVFSIDAESSIIVRGKLVMDPERHACTWDANPLTLTVTQFRILRALAQRPGIVKSRESLTEAAYGGRVHVDDRTIDGHIKKLRQKFTAADSCFDGIETRYGLGYCFIEESS